MTWERVRLSVSGRPSLTCDAPSVPQILQQGMKLEVATDPLAIAASSSVAIVCICRTVQICCTSKPALATVCCAIVAILAYATARLIKKKAD